MNSDNRMMLSQNMYTVMYRGMHRYLDTLDLISPNKVTTPYTYFSRPSLVDYYNSMRWDLEYDEPTNNYTVPEKRLTFFLLTL